MNERQPHPLDGIDIRHEDFVGIYDGLFTQEECESMTSIYTDQVAMPKHYLKWDDRRGRDEDGKFVPGDRTWQTKGDSLKIKDRSMGFDEYVYGIHTFGTSLELFHGENGDGVMQKFFAGFEDWVKKYGADANSRWTSLHWKFQETKALDGSGYHVWHTEHCGRNPMRFGVWMLYLNDIDVGGETEFLYYGKRIQPKQGTLIVWPAGITHMHRGNPPVSDTKYVLTGWLEYLS